MRPLGPAWLRSSNTTGAEYMANPITQAPLPPCSTPGTTLARKRSRPTSLGCSASTQCTSARTRRPDF